MEMISGLVEFCNSHHQIYIYGAGKFGRILCLFLEEHNIVVSGFVVSHITKEAKVLGHSVYEITNFLDELNCLKSDCGIIIALNSNDAKSVEDRICDNPQIDTITISDQKKIEKMAGDLSYKRKYWFDNNIMVLVYHRVGDIGIDSRKLSITTKLFEEQLIYLKENYNIIRTDDNWDDAPNDSVVLTFDDGYYDFYNTVRPILEKNAIPATVFVSTGNIGKDGGLWGDVLEQLLYEAELPDSKDGFVFKGNNYVFHNNEERIQVMFQLRNILKNDTCKNRNKMLGALENALGVIYEPRENHRIMNEKEILKCSKSPYITIGAHTITHCCLAFEDAKTQYYEMKKSKEHLESITGKAIDVFAYPYGTHEDFNCETIDLAIQIGFKKVFAAYEGMTSSKYVNGRIPRSSIAFCEDIESSSKRLNLLKHIYGDPYV